MNNDNWREPVGRALVVVLAAALVFGYLMPATSYFSAVPGDIGDARLNSVFLEHLYRVVTGRYHGGLWNPDFYYPYPGILAFSENHFGSAATYILGRLAGLPREQAFNAWFCFGVVLNFGSALYALRRFGMSTAAAGLGAIFFACALPVPGQDTHAQFVHRFPIPLAALALWQALERKRFTCLGWVAFFVVWQFYCSIYLGVFLAYLLAALTAARLILDRSFAWNEWRAGWAADTSAAKYLSVALILASGSALTYLGSKYYDASTRYGLEYWPASAVIGQLLPRPGSYLLADQHPFLRWLGQAVEVPMRWEHQLFIGFGAIALVLLALIAARRNSNSMHKLAWAMLLALAILVVGTLRVADLSLYYLITDVPGIRALRGVSRIILVMLMPLSVLIAIGADSVWLRTIRLRTSLAVLTFLAVLVTVEPLTIQTLNTPIGEWRQRLDKLKASLPSSVPADAILFVRTSSPRVDAQLHSELDGMLLGQELGRPVLNGYSAFAPPGYRLGACVSAKRRLDGYSHFTGGTNVSGYERRVVILDLDICP